MPLAVTAHRLTGVGPVAVLVVAEDPQPVAETSVRSERRKEPVRDVRVRIEFERPAPCQRTAVFSKSLPLLSGSTWKETDAFHNESALAVVNVVLIRGSALP